MARVEPYSARDAVFSSARRVALCGLVAAGVSLAGCGGASDVAAPAAPVTDTALPGDLQPVRAGGLLLGVPADWREDPEAQERGEDVAYVRVEAGASKGSTAAHEDEDAPEGGATAAAGETPAGGHDDHEDAPNPLQRLAMIASDLDAEAIGPAVDGHVSRTLETLPQGKLVSRADRTVPGAQSAVAATFTGQGVDSAPQTMYDLYVRTARYDVLVRLTTRDPVADPGLAERILGTVRVIS